MGNGLEIMNTPVEYECTDQDIIQEYDISQDMKKVAKIWGMTVKEVGKVLELRKQEV